MKKAAPGLELTAQGRLSLVAGVSPSAGRKGTSPSAGLFVGTQLVWLVGEGVNQRVGGGLNGCRLRVVDVVLGVHGQILLDRVVNQVEVFGHTGGRQVRAGHFGWRCIRTSR